MTTALVCSGGGHLKQLSRLAPRMWLGGSRLLDDEIVWVTFETGLSRSLLEGHDVCFVRYTKPRDYAGVLRLTLDAERLVRNRKVDRVVTTGANVALAFLLSTLTRRGDFHYIESAARTDAPSETGRVMAHAPGVHRYAQYPWLDRRWRYAGSVFDSFRPGSPRQAKVQRVVVTAGTTDSFSFRRLFARAVRILPPGAEVLWQTGSTDVSGLRRINPRSHVPSTELAAAVADADVVISHAGAGSALTALELGRHPILVPRESAFNEHVDDHQQQIARELDRRGLALCCAVGQLDLQALQYAASRTVETVSEPLPFPLARMGDSRCR